MNFVVAALGLALLVCAGDLLVRGAILLSRRIGISPLIVSLTIVALGTSAPEMVVSVDAVIEGAPALAIGNIVGSNIANILLVLGLPALLFGLTTSGTDLRGGVIQMLGATGLLVLLALGGSIGWIGGLVLLSAYFLMMMAAIRTARRQRAAGNADDADGETAEPMLPGWRIALLLLGGLVGLPIGADLLVQSGTAIARDFNISELVIGLTLVAVGTSLPELATSISAGYRRQAAVILGNAIGSNVANILAILGLSSLFGRIPVEDAMLHYDIPVMVAAALLILPFTFLRLELTRIWGLVFCALYAGYVLSLLAG